MYWRRKRSTASSSLNATLKRSHGLIVKLGEKVAGVRKLVGEASEVMIQVTRYVLEFTPLGTFGLIAALVGGYGFEQLRPLLMFVVALYAACAFHIVVVYSALLLAHGLSPLPVLRHEAGHAAPAVPGVPVSSEIA